METKRFLAAAGVALLCIACQRDAEVADTGVTTGTATTVADTNVVTPPEVRSLGWGAWHDWDVDANKLVNRDEFNNRFGTVYTGWAGTDNTLAADEAADTWRDLFDRNNDNFVDTQEWDRGNAEWNLRDYTWGGLAEWDTDRDNRIAENEWDARFGRVRANATWSRDELADTWWDWWDGNDDNMIDENEWNARSGYWRDNA